MVSTGGPFFLALAVFGGIALLIYSALSHAARVLLRDESGYDAKARREATLSAMFALVVAALVVLVLGLLVWCICYFRAFFLE